MFLEDRKKDRIKCALHVKLFTETDHLYKDAVILNYGQEGLLIKTSIGVMPGEIISFQIVFSERYADGYDDNRFWAEVIWCRQENRKQGSHFLLGAKYLDLFEGAMSEQIQKVE